MIVSIFFMVTAIQEKNKKIIGGKTDESDCGDKSIRRIFFGT